MTEDTRTIIDFRDVSRGDVGLVGGKNASLGEMIQNLGNAGVRVPGGFAVTAHAYREFLRTNGLDGFVAEKIEAWHGGSLRLEEAGRTIREAIGNGDFPASLAEDICRAYAEMNEEAGRHDVDVAVRSSATAEDLPEASFAGQQETYLNVQGERELLDAVRKCFASLFTDRAMTYRDHHGFAHDQVALSVGVQLMVRADSGGAGVMFTVDTETGFPRMIVINAAWGLGENVVKGVLTPDEYRVFKPLLERDGARPILMRKLGHKEKKMIYDTGGRQTKNVETSDEERTEFVLSDDQVLQLARWGCIIEEHYDCPMDVEWALDGEDGELYIVQARPETVHSGAGGELVTYTLQGEGEVLTRGVAVGGAVACGRARVLSSMEEADQFEDGDILVTSMTDPDWVPLMKRASGLVTDHGGRTSHAAIVSRELGLAAVVGTGDATTVIEGGATVTLVCSEGPEGLVYEGEIPFESETLDLSDLPDSETEVMLNVANAEAAMHWWQLPTDGVGLARIEFIIEHQIGVHPLALARYDELEDEEAKAKIDELTARFDDRTEYFVDGLARAIATIAAAQYPRPVIVRMSDFKTNEYADLLGGRQFEPHEENPMLGFRGASRYYSDHYRDGFGLECRAIERVRAEIGLDNVVVMIPFCRTLDEADRVLDVMRGFGLERGEDGLQVYVMAEIPSNVILTEEFAERFDGFSIGSNDLTQLVLGADRDSRMLAQVFDERDEAVKRMIAELIERAHACGRHVGICGQAPSDHPEFARFLVECGIDAISVNPDSVVAVRQEVARAETE